ncbi:MAG: glycosyltransferase family 4 protein [Chloroflexi bacterium]|nr:glycosyltransferase family 4 protein [Chloroflexota bacterium]
MIIGVDLYPQLIFTTGVRVVIDNLLTNLKTNHPEHTFVELRPTYRPLPTERFGKLAKLFNHLQRVYWTQVDLPLLALQHRCDLLFCTCHFNPYHQVVPTVTLFYDMAVFRESEQFPRWWVALNRIFALQPSQQNIHLTTISEISRRDIMHVLGRPATDVTAIHLGVSLLPAVELDDAAVLRGYGVFEGDEYIMHLGLAAPHKNLPNLVRGFARLRQLLPERRLKLLLAGPASNAHGGDELDLVRAVAAEAGVADWLIVTGYVPQEHCAVLYRNAAVYAFPSRFEGFGLPMVEAMTHGVPVVASWRTSLPEIGGDAALYFDPDDPDQIAYALLLPLTQPALRAAMVRRGREQAAHFTWERAAAEYIALFERLVGAGAQLAVPGINRAPLE